MDIEESNKFLNFLLIIFFKFCDINSVNKKMLWKKFYKCYNMTDVLKFDFYL